MTCKLKIKRLTKTAKLPTKAHHSDTGYDLYCDRIEDSIDKVTVYTGIAVEPEEGWYIECAPRSSCHKFNLFLSNSIGVIDNSYRGEIRAIFWKVGGVFLPSQKLQVGDKIIQMYPRRLHDFEIEEVSELSETVRGTGGFGSTGK